MKTITTILAAGAIFVTAARGQDFQDLDFESAYNLPANPPGNVAPLGVTNGLPGWEAYNLNNALINIYYVSNNFPGSSSAVELEGGSLALSGTFSAALFSDGSISQTGSVPADAESLEFEAEGLGAGGSIAGSDLSVTLGGQNLVYSALSKGPGYTVYGANIPAGLDGAVETLTFGCLGGVGSGNVLLDNIQFSTSSIPEPGEGALLGLGVVLFGACRKHLTAKST